MLPVVFLARQYNLRFHCRGARHIKLHRLFATALIRNYLFAAVATPVEKRLGVPIEAEDGCNPSIGAATFVSDARDCQVFYICDHGWPKITRCPGVTIWTQIDDHEGRCEAPENGTNSVCGYVRPPPPTVTEEKIRIEDGLAYCEWHCVNSAECITNLAVCDGVQHCSDGSDESDCAVECDPRTCRLPGCRCSNTDVPGGLLPTEVPQLVMLTWESAIRLEDYNHLLQQVFKKVNNQRKRIRRENPNGCPMVGTFFINHQFNDYAATQDLYHDGHEIAAMSISHVPDVSNYWQELDENMWAREIADQKQMFEHLSFVPESSVVGMRAPYLQLGGNRQFSMLQDNGFRYDMSWPTQQMEPPLWPYTLEYRSTQECVVAPCPTASFPGLWEVPMVDWLDTNDTVCNNVDGCYFPLSKEESLTLLRSNFRRHYETNRAPFPLNLRARWFYEAHYNIEALTEFLDELEALPDVYLVTVSQTLDWIMNPSRISDTARFFTCDYSDRLPLCKEPISCTYLNITHPPNSIEHQGDRRIETCATTCPPRYPWVNNPDGNL
ncbi:PREDICTED: uncharacterized protein LOC106806660 [Priapulus caudatus]|uniref:Uncharacterized protein LOC106806660 n=1 Tax=Priapulus caudatus TaxID=37621 RepID=A0ABM1DW37_PRICU|nr:PREDICTED: uncharacterized protein LOC106806660 [Priapulus caudatus]